MMKIGKVVLGGCAVVQVFASAAGDEAHPDFGSLSDLFGGKDGDHGLGDLFGGDFLEKLKDPEHIKKMQEHLGSIHGNDTMGFLDEHPLFGGSSNISVPTCRAQKCDDPKQVLVQDFDHIVWSYGCDINAMMPAGFKHKEDQPHVNHCCIQRDVCHQTCGKTLKECHDEWKQCTVDACGDHQDCKMMADMFTMDMPRDESMMNMFNSNKTHDEMRCMNYEKHQKSACKCISKHEAELSMEEVYHRYEGPSNGIKALDFENLNKLPKEALEKVTRDFTEKLLVAYNEKSKQVEMREDHMTKTMKKMDQKMKKYKGANGQFDPSNIGDMFKDLTKDLNLGDLTKNFNFGDLDGLFGEL